MGAARLAGLMALFAAAATLVVALRPDEGNRSARRGQAPPPRPAAIRPRLHGPAGRELSRSAEKEWPRRLRILRTLRGHAFDIVEQPARLESLFPAGTAGEEETRADHRVLEEGRHEIALGEGPLVVEGAGRSLTRVRLRPSRPRNVRGVVFRDVTIDCGNAPLLDLSGDAPATLRLERCRVLGFDGGSGGSVMVSGRTVVFHASDCRIEGGHGRAPGSGSLFRVRGVLLARLDGCTIRGPLKSVYDAHDRATTVFADCAFEGFERADATLRRHLAHPPAGVSFERCRFPIVKSETERKKTGPTAIPR